MHTLQVESKGLENIYRVLPSQDMSAAAIIISDKINSKARSITIDKERFHNDKSVNLKNIQEF